MTVPWTLMAGALATLASLLQSRSINVGDAVIRYEISGEGTPLVLVHGWAQDLTIWDAQVPAFAQHHRVIRYDRRGYGKSTGDADATADPMDLRILLDSLGIRSAYILGLSAGSRTALNFAVAFPDRVKALVVYGQALLPGFAPVPDGPTPVMIFREIAQKQGLDSAGRALMAHQLSWVPEDRTDVREVLKAVWTRYSGRDLLDPRPESGRVPHARLDQIAMLRVPTLVISGDHDLPLFLQVADTLVRRIAGAQRVLIPNAGHGAHFARPMEFNAAVLRFLADVERRPFPQPLVLH
jgi:pimeloyl-ACP methyl ester carboxylesterase